MSEPRKLGRGQALVLGSVLAAFALAFAAVWAIPNVAGAAFVDVRAIASARVGTGGPAGGPSVSIGSEGPVTALEIQVAVEATNRYPLAVVVGSGNVAFQAAVYRRGGDGSLSRFWAASAADPGMEEGSDSPGGGDSANAAAVVAPGTSRHVFTTAFPLTDASGAPIPSGAYYLRVWAYGIESPFVPISVG